MIDSPNSYQDRGFPPTKKKGKKERRKNLEPEPLGSERLKKIKQKNQRTQKQCNTNESQQNQ
jgi:hypothetical protein